MGYLIPFDIRLNISLCFRTNAEKLLNRLSLELQLANLLLELKERGESVPSRVTVRFKGPAMH